MTHQIWNGIKETRNLPTAFYNCLEVETLKSTAKVRDNMRPKLNANNYLRNAKDTAP